MTWQTDTGRKALKEAPRCLCFNHSILATFYYRETLKLRSCSQSTKVSIKWQDLLQESIGVGHKSGINRKFGMDFQEAPKMAHMLSLKVRRGGQSKNI